jgi:hypothetical protein
VVSVGEQYTAYGIVAWQLPQAVKDTTTAPSRFSSTTMQLLHDQSWLQGMRVIEPLFVSAQLLSSMAPELHVLCCDGRRSSAKSLLVMQALAMLLPATADQVQPAQRVSLSPC